MTGYFIAYWTGNRLNKVCGSELEPLLTRVSSQLAPYLQLSAGFYFTFVCFVVYAITNNLFLLDRIYKIIS
jgi:hypothetical protein